MKKNHLFFAPYLFGLVLFLLSSCGDRRVVLEPIDLNPENVFKNSIGVLTVSGDFQKLDRVELNRVIKSNITFTNKSVEFQDFLIKEELDENKNKIYYLSSSSTDNSASVSIKLKQDDIGNLLLTQDSCTCESTDCPNGCNASGSGSSCACSFCTRACKKTSTTGDEPGGLE